MPQKGRQERAEGPNTRIAQTQDDNGLIRNVIMCNSKLGQGPDRGSYCSSSPTLDWTYSKGNCYDPGRNQTFNSPAVAGVATQPNGGNGDYKKSGYQYQDERPAFKSRVSVTDPEYKIYKDCNYHTSEKEMRMKVSKYMMEKSFIQKNKDYIKQLQAKNAAEYNNSNSTNNNGNTDEEPDKNITKKSKGRPIYIPKYMGGKQSDNENDAKKVNGNNGDFNIDEEAQFLDNIDKFLDNIDTNSDAGLLDALEETKKKIDNKIEEIKKGSKNLEGANNLGESPFEDVQVMNNNEGEYEGDGVNQAETLTSGNPKSQTDKEIIDSIVNTVPPEERDALYVNE